jgi:thiol-disulfide isomerase/thioredoxin
VGRTVQIAAPDLAGREVRIAPGGPRLTVVDFWATWCEPCREQLPFLAQLRLDYRERGVEVYAVSFDEDPAAVEEFLERMPQKLPVLWDKEGATLAERLEITRLPTTIVVDEAGVVRAVHLGFDRAEAAALERDLVRLLGR